MEINISTEQARFPVTIFKIDGFINLGTSNQLEDQATETYKSGSHYLLLDLSNVNSLSSAGLRAILYIYKLFEGEPKKGDPANTENRVKKYRGKSSYVKIVNPRPEIRRILEISGFEQFIEIFENTEQALKSF